MTNPFSKCGIGEGAIDPLTIGDLWRSSPT